MSSSNRTKKKIKLALFFTIAVVIGIVLTVFIGYRKDQGTNELMLSSDQSKASISIGKVHQTATKNGVKEWSLVADSVHYIQKENHALFHNLKVVFYMQDGNIVHVSADRGYLKTDSNDIEVEGNVVVDNGSYKIETESMSYKHTSRILFTDNPVKVSGELFTLSADTVSLNLNTQKSDFKGKVKGVLSEDFEL